MKNIVLLEGPDCCGKTTLAQKFVDEGYKYFHCTYEPDMNVTLHHVDIAMKAWREPGNVVVDRMYLSEYIYGTVYRDGWYGYNKLRVVRGLLEPTAKIICLPPFEICKEQMLARIDEEMYKDIDKMQEVWSMYNEYLDDQKYDEGWEHYDWSLDK